MKKVLRAIGGFFAKIGRWIANTAWIQPLLIVGGIFAVIFSIPYIKRGIEGLVAANNQTDELAYYRGKSISLTNAEKGESQFDKLLTYLEDGEYESAKSEFGEKFFLSFVNESCGNCKECIGGFSYLEGHFHDDRYACDGDFKLYTVFIDTLNDDDVNLTKKVFETHEDLFDNIVAQFAENEDYPLLKNVKDKSSLISSIDALGKAVNGDEDISTPTTFMIDLSQVGQSKESFVFGITAIFFNYTSLVSDIDSSADNNDMTKAQVLADCWNYNSIFDPEFEGNN